MRIVADLHIHSKYSRATSRDLDLPNLWAWAQMKGIDVIGTGDFTHPQWFQELSEQLEETALGFYQLKEAEQSKAKVAVPVVCQRDVYFVPTVEISTIYKKKDRVRKIHQIIVAPNLKQAARLNEKLDKIGNIRSDGRPILGLDSKELLKLVLSLSEDFLYIPAHAWTPHFAVFGSQSGFDSLKECYEELTPNIYAIETGLSSDPPMNWRLSQLDNLVLVSNSDAHSPQKLGREANLLDIEPNYPALYQAIREHRRDQFLGTIEFFPEEGKYHLDGHRDCGVCLEPQESLKREGLCPKCGRKLVLGVLHLVEKLADKPYVETQDFASLHTAARPFESIIPLAEMVAEMMGVKSSTSPRVQNLYFELLAKFGSEFFILRQLDLTTLANMGYQKLSEGIVAMREGRVLKKAGYDGEFGVIKVFQGVKQKKQMKLFSD
ncbi:DNA helicase UvrD [Candidatus Peregrinibacteria bacterium]|nr:DNA helicase UvrD [Candidatus Peregrinibacteria bacterium]